MTFMSKFTLIVHLLSEITLISIMRLEMDPTIFVDMDQKRALYILSCALTHPLILGQRQDGMMFTLSSYVSPLTGWFS